MFPQICCFGNPAITPFFFIIKESVWKYGLGKFRNASISCQKKKECIYMTISPLQQFQFMCGQEKVSAKHLVSETRAYLILS